MIFQVTYILNVFFVETNSIPKVRIPFPNSPVTERKDVKVAIMEMTNAAAGQSQES